MAAVAWASEGGLPAFPRVELLKARNLRDRRYLWTLSGTRTRARQSRDPREQKDDKNTKKTKISN